VKRVLVVDDDLTTRNGLAEFLTDAGFECTAVGTFQEAVALLRTLPRTRIARRGIRALTRINKTLTNRRPLAQLTSGDERCEHLRQEKNRIMRWQFVTTAAIAVACVTTACNGSGNLGQPSSLPSVASPGNGSSSQGNGAPQSSNDSPSLCTSTEPCPGGVQAGPPPERSCSMMTNGIEVVVNGSRQSNGTVLANQVGQVPPRTQPAPPGNDLVVGPGAGNNGSHSVARGDALGAAANIQGQCPNLTFTVGGTPVMTNGSTRYFGLPSPPPPRS
jgi:CheY-like chemotaxis protein